MVLINMAAGRIDVSRRRVYDGYSNKYFDHYRKGARGVDLNRAVEHGVVYKNGYPISSNARNLCVFKEVGLVAEMKRESWLICKVELALIIPQGWRTVRYPSLMMEFRCLQPRKGNSPPLYGT